MPQIQLKSHPVTWVAWVTIKYLPPCSRIAWRTQKTDCPPSGHLYWKVNFFIVVIPNYNYYVHKVSILKLIQFAKCDFRLRFCFKQFRLKNVVKDCSIKIRSNGKILVYWLVKLFFFLLYLSHNAKMKKLTSCEGA